MKTLGIFRASALMLALALAPAAAQIGPPPVTASGGAVASISSICPTAAAATGAVVINGGIGMTNVTAATDSIGSNDCGGAKTYANASGTAVSLGSAVTLGAKFTINLAATSTAGTVTITSAGGNFSSNGTSSLSFVAGQSLGLVSDGTNWAVFAGKSSGGGGSPGGSSGQIQINTSGSFAGTTTGAGVLTALGANVGSPGAVVVNGGALGAPSSATLTNATGLPLAGLSGLGSGWSTALATTYSASGSCSGSFCALTAGTNWTTALAANLGNGWPAALGATFSAGGGSPSDRFLGAKTGNNTNTFWTMDTIGTPVSSSAGYTIGAVYCSPFTVPYSLSISALIFDATTLGTASAHAYIYADAVDATNNNWHYPGGAPIASDNNTPADTAVGPITFTFAAPVSLTLGSIYWKCFQAGDTAVRMQILNTTSVLSPYQTIVGARTAAHSFAGNGGAGLSIAGAFGTAPNTSAATSWGESPYTANGAVTSSAVISSIP